MTVVLVEEKPHPQQKRSTILSWILFTDQEVKSEEDAMRVIFYYRLRWQVGASRQGRINKSVRVRPRSKDSRPRSMGGTIERKCGGALRQHSLKGGCAKFQVVS